MSGGGTGWMSGGGLSKGSTGRGNGGGAGSGFVGCCCIRATDATLLPLCRMVTCTRSGGARDLLYRRRRYDREYG